MKHSARLRKLHVLLAMLGCAGGVLTGAETPPGGPRLLSLSAVSNAVPAGLRVRVQGTLLLETEPGYLILMDETGSLRVQFSGTNPPAWTRGDLLEAEGLPVMSDNRPWLVADTARRLGTGNVPPPVRVRASDALQQLYDARHVTVRGRVVGTNSYTLRRYTSEVLLTDSDGVLTKMMFPQGTQAEKLFPIGTVADFSGFCRVGQRVDESQTRYLHVVLPGPEGVTVVQKAPRWSAEQVRRALLTLFVLGVLVAAWAVFQWRKTRLLRASEELRVALAAEKELNQLKSLFVSMVSHEFRTPLEVILTSSNILDRYLDRLPPEKRRAQLRAIRKSVHRMNDLIEDVLLLGKLDAGRLACHPAPIDLLAVCRKAAVEIESAAGRDGAVQITADPLADATGDEALLHHILTNLLGNALKYSPPKGVVTLAVRASGVDAELIIVDRGCGIPAADQARLFTQFYRGSNVGQTPGSGLGLVIVQRCVDLHGGTIRCTSEVGAGTTFTVRLPLFDGTRVWRRRADNFQTTASPAGL